MLMVTYIENRVNDSHSLTGIVYLQNISIDTDLLNKVT